LFLSFFFFHLGKYPLEEDGSEEESFRDLSFCASEETEGERSEAKEVEKGE